jgi:hypothetical protein
LRSPKALPKEENLMRSVSWPGKSVLTVAERESEGRRDKPSLDFLERDNLERGYRFLR